MSEYKQCPNGHYYQGDHCPYCKSGGNASGSATSMKTEVFGINDSQQPTETMPGYGAPASGGEKTTMVDGGTIIGGPGARPAAPSGSAAPMSGRTVFGDEDEVESVPTPNGGERVQRVYREARKIVGWLVSYTLDPLGVDFKLYEGRNIIGRDMDCNITVNDNMVSSKHAVLLFRAGKYSITDSQSSHGTFVNDEDIELEPRYIKDGDIIKIGKTLFKFRTSF
ncbi:MAG: FHA domain-containing protein [Bacteroidales bacterium]|nr:FHA domain-containing protein [Bacteroidales bacterium]